MISTRASIIVLLLLISSVFIFTYHVISDRNVTNTITVDNLNVSNNSSSNINQMWNETNVSIDDEILVLPSEDTILKDIHWSNYPLLCNQYIHDHEISDPTEVVDHKFLYVVIVVEINDAKNQSEIIKQISEVVLEERRILGPNSGPTVWGTVDGICVYYAALRPYETDVFARYLP